MIYFIQAADGTGPIKIGSTRYPQTRLEHIQRMCPVELKILQVIKGEKMRECAIHRRFAQSRLHGEWFESTKELLDFIEGSTEVLEYESEDKPEVGVFNMSGMAVTRALRANGLLENASLSPEQERVAKINTLVTLLETKNSRLSPGTFHE